MQTQPIQKTITFSPVLYTMLEKKADKIGVSFSDYITLLAIEDINEEGETIEMVDADTEKHIGKSLNDIAKGRHTVLKNTDGITCHFAKLFLLYD